MAVLSHGSVVVTSKHTAHKSASYLSGTEPLMLVISSTYHITFSHRTIPLLIWKSVCQASSTGGVCQASSTGGTCSMPLVQDSTIAGCHLWVGQNHLHIAEIKSSVLHALPVHTSTGGVSFKKVSQQDIISLLQKTSVFESWCEQVQKNFNIQA